MTNLPQRLFEHNLATCLNPGCYHAQNSLECIVLGPWEFLPMNAVLNIPLQGLGRNLHIQ